VCARSSKLPAKLALAYSGGTAGRCGWRWCLDALMPEPGPEEERDSARGGDQRSKVAALLRKLRFGA
jgi:hypothetical protein